MARTATDEGAPGEAQPRPMTPATPAVVASALFSVGLKRSGGPAGAAGGGAGGGAGGAGSGAGGHLSSPLSSTVLWRTASSFSSM
jgi:hypothetical protein